MLKRAAQPRDNGQLQSKTRCVGFALALMAATGTSRAQDFLDHSQAAAERNTFGEVGLFDMPSAHQAPDGQLAFTLGNLEKAQRYSLDFQALPWLETSFRYSHVPDWNGLANYFDRSFGLKARVLKEDGIWPDVSLGIRDLLGTGVYSAEYLVASKHIGDFDVTTGLGWGRLASRPAFNNPLITFSQSFDTRKQPSYTGAVDVGAFFHGQKAGVFGGVAWQTPIPDLKILAEYSADRYAAEEYYGGLRVRSPVNVGLSYHPFSTMAVSAGWYYGTTYGVVVSVGGDPTTTYPSALRIGPKATPPALRTDEQQTSAIEQLRTRNSQRVPPKVNAAWVEIPTLSEQTKQNLRQALHSQARGVREVELQGDALIVDAHFASAPDKQCQSYAQIAFNTHSLIRTLVLTDLQEPKGTVVVCQAGSNEVKAALVSIASDQSTKMATAREKIIADLSAQGMQTSALSIGTSDLWIYYENYKYNRGAVAAGRVIRILMADAPPSVELFHIVPSFLGVPDRTITVSRSGMERAFTNNVSVMSNAIAIAPPPATNPLLRSWDSSRYPVFSWSLDPKLTEHVFDPDAPLQFLIYGNLSGLLQIAPGLSLETQLTGTIWSNYSYDRGADSALPHVRTEILQYIKRGRYGVADLHLDYRTHVAPTVYAEVRAGLLEDMFMGAGGQILWRPEDSRFSIGADLYQVWQRDYDRLFGRLPYNAVTGHVTVYYDSPWKGINFALHAGRYLAGDTGATLEISRRFESGVEIGAWATITNVPFSKFGEGSFDKGIMLHIPFEWGLPIWSQASYNLHLSSLTRDGGQRLAGDDSLYGLTLGNSYGEFAKHPEDLLDP